MFVLLAFQHKTLQFKSVMTVTAFSGFAFENYVIFTAFFLSCGHHFVYDYYFPLKLVYYFSVTGVFALKTQLQRW